MKISHMAYAYRPEMIRDFEISPSPTIKGGRPPPLFFTYFLLQSLSSYCPQLRSPASGSFFPSLSCSSCQESFRAILCHLRPFLSSTFLFLGGFLSLPLFLLFSLSFLAMAGCGGFESERSSKEERDLQRVGSKNPKNIIKVHIKSETFRADAYQSMVGLDNLAQI